MPKRWIIGGTWAALMSAGMLAGIRNATAEQSTKPEKVIISEVIISGNHQMSTAQIKSHLHTQPSKVYNPAIVDDDVRELYKTGQFSSITTWLLPDGIDRVKIYFGVREMPNIVQKVTFLGAKHIKVDELQNVTGVRPSTPLNPNLNRLGCEKIIYKYAEQCRWLADCQLIKGGDMADTEVVYQITEGPKVKVRDIRFTGNTFASAARLGQKVPFPVGGSTYNRKTAEEAINTLCTYYRDFGYRDVRIHLEVKRESASDEVTLIYHIREGRRYRTIDDPERR